MNIASTRYSCISWFVVNTRTTERARDRPFSFLGQRYCVQFMENLWKIYGKSMDLSIEISREIVENHGQA